MPSKIQISVLPLKLIPAQMWSFKGCLGLGLGLGVSPFFLQQNRQWVSSCTVHSSVYTVYHICEVIIIPLPNQVSLLY